MGSGFDIFTNLIDTPLSLGFLVQLHGKSCQQDAQRCWIPVERHGDIARAKALRENVEAAVRRVVSASPRLSEPY
jgi:hypothetical protein